MVFHEKWDKVRINKHGRIATVVANYTLTADKEVRQGMDVITLLMDGDSWRIISLVYEQKEIGEA